MGYLPLGEPPQHDVEAAARLLLRYRREAPLSPEGGQMFAQSVDDPQAVARRADELEQVER